MKWIQKRNEPQELTEWRARYAKDVNFHYRLIDHDTRKAIINSLLQEQGWLCAYTGRRIAANTCHIEHVKAQEHCTRAETVTYTNMVACYPAPNPKHKTPYGAEQKGSWPDPSERHLFVSPLDQACESRFIFKLQGDVISRKGDEAATVTIQKLNLDCPELKTARKAAIQGTLGKTNDLSIDKARKHLKKLQSQQDGQLDEFCFVLVQALNKHIARLEAIAKSKKEKSNKKS